MKPEEQAELLKEIEEIVKRREVRAEKKNMQAPLVKIDTVQKNRTPVGTGRSIVLGVPIDVFDLESIYIESHPTDLKTILRYEGSRIIEQMRNNERITGEGKKSGFNWTIILIIIVVIAAIGLGVIFFLPKIMSVLGGLIPH